MLEEEQELNLDQNHSTGNFWCNGGDSTM